ncbi:50S ribosomal protein L13 [Candidatus Microgenomates bacterium]|nr:50S ribosomal protein L13 [Candidatus Microgenomates bacterium]
MNITYQPKAKEIKKEWHLITARGQVLGRMATEIARLLIGKHKKTYVPHLDSGDYVVVTEAKEVLLTGKKAEQKTYTRYSGYPSGLHKTKFSELKQTHPERIIEHAVSGMLPDNRLKGIRMARLKVFASKEHPYTNKFEARSTKSETN